MATQHRAINRHASARIDEHRVANLEIVGIDIAHRVYLEGAGLQQLLPDLLPLIAMAAITLPVAAWMFRNRLV